MKHIFFQVLLEVLVTFWIVPHIWVYYWGALCPLLSCNFGLHIVARFLVGYVFLLFFILSSEHCNNFRHVSLEYDGNLGISLHSCGASVPDQLALPADPLGSCLKLVVICWCDKVALLCLTDHYLEYFWGASLFFWCLDVSWVYLDGHRSKLGECPVSSCSISIQSYYFSWLFMNPYPLIFFFYLLK